MTSKEIKDYAFVINNYKLNDIKRTSVIARIIVYTVYSIVIGIVMYLIIGFSLLEYDVLLWPIDGRVIWILMCLLPHIAFIINHITRNVILVPKDKLKKRFEDAYNMGAHIQQTKYANIHNLDPLIDFETDKLVLKITDKKLSNVFIKELE